MRTFDWSFPLSLANRCICDSPTTGRTECDQGLMIVIEILDDMLHALENEDSSSHTARRRMNIEKVIENELVPLLKVCTDDTIFEKAVRLMANLTQPFDLCTQPATTINESISNELRNLVSSAKNECTDMDFLKAFSTKMKEMLKKETLDQSSTQCLNHCVLLLRNLFHVRPGTPANDQASITHQCLVSSFFMNELDKVIYTMLNHKNKESWTIGLAQLISFLFKDYSASLLEPDIDDTRSASSSDDNHEVVELIAQADRTPPGSSEQNLTTNFKRHLRIGTASENSSRSSEDDDFMLEFKSTDDGRLEIKLTNCTSQQEDSAGSGSGEEMEVGDSTSKETGTTSGSKDSSKDPRGSNSSLSSDPGVKDSAKVEGSPSPPCDNMEVMSSMNASSCLMDMDILVSYLKKFATDIMYSGFVDLVENIMRALLKKYDTIFDHSFLMWTVGFFLSFALQQDLEFENFKEILNLDVFGFLVYEGVVCSEAVQVKYRQKQDCSVEKHRLHLVVCTLNQMFRTVMANRKVEYVLNIQKCLSHMSELHNLFVLLIRHHLPNEQSAVYLRDLVQTNHILMLMIEEWLAEGFIQDNANFSMLSHVKKFATKKVMAKYGSLLEHQEFHKDTLNVAVLTMMYHVAGSCQRQETLMQLPILKSFSEIWVDNAVREHEEFRDLIEFVLEVFMSQAEKDPDQTAQNLFEINESPTNSPEGHGSRPAIGEGSQSESADAESSMNMSTSTRDEFTDEEQVLIFTWASEMQMKESASDIIVRKLQEHGYSKTKEQVTKYLKENGFIPDSSPTPSSSSSSSSLSAASAPEEDTVSIHENRDILHELSSLSEDNLVPFLLDKLKAQGFESHLVWLQKQLLEAAYVKLAIKQPAYRIHVEEPVPKVFALQNKAIPIVPWDEELDEVLTNPYFHLLQQSLGLYTNDDPNVIFPRIPQYLTPTLLVNKARQIGPFDSLTLKFDLDTLKEGTDLDIGQEKPSTRSHNIMKTVKPMDSRWLNFVMQVNGDMNCGQCSS